MEPEGTLELQCLGLWGRFPPLLLWLETRPRVAINGTSVKGAWGTKQYALAPGNYHIDVSVRQGWHARANRAKLDIVVLPQRVVTVRYRTHIAPFLRGRIAVVDEVALAKIHTR